LTVTFTFGLVWFFVVWAMLFKI